MFLNSLNLNLFKFYGKKDNKILNSIIWLYERKEKWEYTQIDYFENQRFDVLFHIAIDQYEKTSNYIPQEQIRCKDEIYNKDEINEDSIVGAGSVITKNVKKKTLALTRSPQLEVKNYKRKKK